jgi:hypothetical protein
VHSKPKVNQNQIYVVASNLIKKVLTKVKPKNQIWGNMGYIKRSK